MGVYCRRSDIDIGYALDINEFDDGTMVLAGKFVNTIDLMPGYCGTQNLSAGTFGGMSSLVHPRRCAFGMSHHYPTTGWSCHLRVDHRDTEDRSHRGTGTQLPLVRFK